MISILTVIKYDYMNHSTVIKGYTLPTTSYKNMDLKELANFYTKLEDIWNYRVGMDIVEKMRILQTNNGNAFMMSINTIKHIKSKIQLQEILLIFFISFNLKIFPFNLLYCILVFTM